LKDVERLSNSATTTQLSGRYPSISTILGCTQSQRNLYWWQLKMIKQLGGEGSFRRYMRAIVEEILGIQIPDAVLGYMRSVLPVLRSLQHSEFTQLEQYAHHHLLCYLGRFDAIVSYRDALLVIDWKTASSGSSKDTMVEMELAKMYNDPLQVAAYIGAINSDMKFSHLPTVHSTLIWTS
uniref:Mitochondrial genome maintenance exonuclease 1 (inferred by orthology to a C. elegans protein) n=1 Tax=Anisakis simplex TaxID=6269 RepID=A0A0M3J4Z8_ANISI